MQQLQQQAAQLARAGWLGQQLAVAVRQVRVVQRLLGCRAKYHAMAVVALQLLVILAQLFGRKIAQVGTQHRKLEGHAGLKARLYTLQQLLI
ncbi:hypothetical protein D3C81_1699020 [compost metagenome]